jgi:hypothetical protein
VTQSGPQQFFTLVSLRVYFFLNKLEDVSSALEVADGPALVLSSDRLRIQSPEKIETGEYLDHPDARLGNECKWMRER